MSSLRAALLSSLALALAVVVTGCAAHATPPAPDPERVALSRASIGVLSREACPRLLETTFALEDPALHATTGKMWVRRCAAEVENERLEVDVDVLGWQWAGESSWGFGVREYVYFTASVHARLLASVEAQGATVGLRVWSDGKPGVEVREIGRVSARAEHVGATLLGLASGMVGRGPNTLATAALRGRVRDVIMERSRSGFEIALGEAPVPGSAATPPGARRSLLDETETLHFGGALLSGAYPAHVATDLSFVVRSPSDGVVLTRAVCVDEAVALVDSVMAGKPRAPDAAAPPMVHELRGEGRITIPPQACRWLLVTGVASGGPEAQRSARDDATTVRLELTRAKPPPVRSARRWVRATLLAFELTNAVDAKLISFSIGAEGQLRPLGQPLTASESPSVWLVAQPVELDANAPLVVTASALKPQSRSWLTGTTTYDETPLGRASVLPSTGSAREERGVPVEKDGRIVGTARIALEIVEAP